MPNKTVWILGDELLDRVSDQLQKAIDKDPEKYYLTHNYQVTVFNTDNKIGYISKNFLIRISNSFITALNASQSILPAVVLIMLDNAFLKEREFAEKHMPRMVELLLDNIMSTIKLRKKQVTNPYWEDNKPKVILLRPLPRPAFSLLDSEKYKNTRRHFSTELENITLKYRVTLANVDEINCSQRVLFDDYGNLSDYGTEKFWKSISDYLRRTDRDEYYAIKKYRTPKKSEGTQTFTQQQTLSVNTAPQQDLIPKQSNSWYPNQNNQQPPNTPNLPHPQYNQYYQPPNDRYHVYRK